MQKAQTWAMRGRSDEYVRRVSAVTAADLGAAADFAFRLPQKLYRVSEVADCLGVSRQTIHNYATAGLISEEGHTPGGQRLFGEGVFHEILLIQRLKPTHRLQEIRRLLAGRRLTIAASDTGGQAASATRERERSRELLSLAHLDESQTVAQPPSAGSDTAEGGRATSPADAMTRAAPDAVAESADRTAVGPGFAVRAPSDEPPPAAPASPERSQAMPERSPADQHVKETPQDDQQRG
jgi:DNA-binding transcriptional MerR regulator